MIKMKELVLVLFIIHYLISISKRFLNQLKNNSKTFKSSASI
jgi:hypothetical protein